MKLEEAIEYLKELGYDIVTPEELKAKREARQKALDALNVIRGAGYEAYNPFKGSAANITSG